MSSLSVARQITLKSVAALKKWSWVSSVVRIRNRLICSVLAFYNGSVIILTVVFHYFRKLWSYAINFTPHKSHTKPISTSTYDRRYICICSLIYFWRMWIIKYQPKRSLPRQMLMAILPFPFKDDSFFK